MANLCCTIEMEPRTLNQGQLHHAREIAVDIVQNKETDEASNVFSEGLKPMVAIKEDAVVVVSDSYSHYVASEAESINEVVKTEIIVGTCCQCSCIDAHITDDRLDAFTNYNCQRAPFCSILMSHVAKLKTMFAKS